MLDRIAVYLRKEMDTRGKVRAAMGLSDGDDGCGHRRDDILADVYPAEVHAVVQVARNESAEADAGDDGPIRRHVALLVSLAVGRGGGGGRIYLWAALRARTEDSGLAEDQRADRRPDVSQGDDQPQHSYAGHDARRRCARDGVHTIGRGPSRRTTSTRNSGPKCSTTWPVANGFAKRCKAIRCFPRVLVQMIAAGEDTGKLDKGVGKSQHLLRRRSGDFAEGHDQSHRAFDDQRDGRGGRHHRIGIDAADIQPQQATHSHKAATAGRGFFDRALESAAHGAAASTAAPRHEGGRVV